MDIFCKVEMTGKIIDGQLSYCAQLVGISRIIHCYYSHTGFGCTCAY